MSSIYYFLGLRGIIGTGTSNQSVPVCPRSVPLSLLLFAKEAAKRGVGIIGPATVGGMMPGRFRIGNAGGAVEFLGMKIQKFGCGRYTPEV